MHLLAAPSLREGAQHNCGRCLLDEFAIVAKLLPASAIKKQHHIHHLLRWCRALDGALQPVPNPAYPRSSATLQWLVDHQFSYFGPFAVIHLRMWLLASVQTLRCPFGDQLGKLRYSHSLPRILRHRRERSIVFLATIPLGNIYLPYSVFSRDSPKHRRYQTQIRRDSGYGPQHIGNGVLSYMATDRKRMKANPTRGIFRVSPLMLGSKLIYWCFTKSLSWKVMRQVACAKFLDEFPPYYACEALGRGGGYIGKLPYLPFDQQGFNTGGIAPFSSRCILTSSCNYPATDGTSSGENGQRLTPESSDQQIPSPS
ncbi:hypothetical protein CCUS01_11466 [Colletotrichum cuscutae]|uniref:Uncharacterized protein n=1 Tax=Colletotrichum cuscutae TaxID=1209917 RepID=A0AAI9XHE0_9PEZI|nr:hypothetical protein CCUS01_11466 [Colletotrichum cuscutae]